MSSEDIDERVSQLQSGDYDLVVYENSSGSAAKVIRYGTNIGVNKFSAVQDVQYNGQGSDPEISTADSQSEQELRRTLRDLLSSGYRVEAIDRNADVASKPDIYSETRLQ